MGLSEKINTFLIRNYRILVALLILGILLISVFLSYSVLILNEGDLNNEINPSIVNGILTATSIIFGFVVFEIREIQSSIWEKFLLSLPLLFFLEYTLVRIYVGAIIGIVTSETALVATTNCLFNILYVLPVMIVKETRRELEQRN